MKGLVVKTLVTLLLLLLIAASVDLSAVASRFLALSPVTAVLLMLITMMQMFLLAYRWRLVSHLVGLPLPFGEAISCILASQFFSQCLPASVGGDALRIWWLGRIGHRFSIATHSVLLDRLAGLLALLFLNMWAVALLGWIIGSPEAAKWLGVTLVVGLIGFVAAASRLARRLGLRLFLAVRKYRRLAGLLRWGLGLQRAVGHLLFLRQGFVILLAGTLIHLVTVLLCYLIARDLGLPVTFIMLCAVVPGVLLISYLPISVGGWGVREGGMLVGLGLIGVTPNDAVFIGLALGALGLIASGIGGVVWLLRPIPNTHTPIGRTEDHP